MFKVAHLRNVYQKVGMFGFPSDAVSLGPQVRGVGFLHDGSIDTHDYSDANAGTQQHAGFIVDPKNLKLQPVHISPQVVHYLQDREEGYVLRCIEVSP